MKYEWCEVLFYGFWVEIHLVIPQPLSNDLMNVFPIFRLPIESFKT
jgi:hypothetical protein